MIYEEDPHTQFGIDEVYFHQEFDSNLIEKLQQRAALNLDAKDNIVLKNAPCDMVLIFRRRVLSKHLVYRFLEFLHQYAEKEGYIKFNTLLNEEELFESVKLKKFILVTNKTLSKKAYHPL